MTLYYKFLNLMVLAVGTSIGFYSTNYFYIKSKEPEKEEKVYYISEVSIESLKENLS